MSTTAALSAAPLNVENVLPQIAALFLAEWKRLRQEPGNNSSAMLRSDQLIVEIRDALTTCEQTRTHTEAGFNEIKTLLDRWLELSYPRLAGQIETLLHCYVTWTDIDIVPNSSTVSVRIGLRDLPIM